MVMPYDDSEPFFFSQVLCSNTQVVRDHLILPMLLHARGAHARKARVGSPRPLLTRWTDGITSPSSSTIFSWSPIFFTLLGLIIQPPPAPAPPVPSAIAAECEMVAIRCRRGWSTIFFRVGLIIQPCGPAAVAPPCPSAIVVAVEMVANRCRRAWRKAAVTCRRG